MGFIWPLFNDYRSIVVGQDVELRNLIILDWKTMNYFISCKIIDYFLMKLPLKLLTKHV